MNHANSFRIAIVLKYLQRLLSCAIFCCKGCLGPSHVTPPNQLRYREGGMEALKGRKAAGPAPKFSGQQLRRLYMIITSNNPLQLGFEFALWTRAMIREVIRDQFGVRLNDVSVGRLLRKLGLPLQRPVWRAYQRDEEKVQAWRKNNDLVWQQRRVYFVKSLRFSLRGAQHEFWTEVLQGMDAISVGVRRARIGQLRVGEGPNRSTRVSDSDSPRAGSGAPLPGGGIVAAHRGGSLARLAQVAWHSCPLPCLAGSPVTGHAGGRTPGPSPCALSAPGAKETDWGHGAHGWVRRG